ncbi:MAG: NAD-dependent epimerase/dehydratase family protein [Alphaproteobacteria bacterium]|nr:NAD-dependent epimerase/dehydratase family protein [Alphaproteobacteria bacterium]
MSYLVTGAAGFIGYHVCEALLARGESVVGVDNLNDYYDVSLKEARRDRLAVRSGFEFCKVDISDNAAMQSMAASHPDITHVIHLAAQAGVRYSLENPFAYVQSNVLGHLVILELCRNMDRLEQLVYASSSSVYGGNTKLPFAIGDPTDTPVSLYAATKKADELMGHCYSHLYGIPATGLRFFTVYGPWGRPDMAAYIFAHAISQDRPIPVFNHGEMRRDFTYIDDIVAGVLAVADKPPADDKSAPHRVYNIGNNHAEPLLRFIELIEQAMGRKATLDLQPMQPGDVKETFADIEAIRRDFGFEPRTSIEDGIPKFIEWFRGYNGV